MTSAIVTILLIGALAAFDIFRKKRIPIDVLRMSLVVYGLVYFIIPEFLPLTDTCEPFCGGVPWLPRVISAVGLIALIAGYFLSYGLPIPEISPKVKIGDKSEYRLILLVLLLSAVALCVYASSFGGFISAFSYGAVARFTGTQNTDVQGSAIALYFVGIAYIAMVVSQFKLYQAPEYRGRYMLALIFSVIVILSYSLINASRGAIFNIPMLALFIHFNVRGLKLTPRKIIVIAVFIGFGLLLTAYGKGVIGSTASIFRGEDASAAYAELEQRDGSYIYGRLISEFSHPIRSIGVLLDHETDSNFMKHFILAPLHLIPASSLGLSDIKPIRITEINTYLLTGETEGGVPPGLVASFWYGGGIAGVLGGCMLFGGFLGWFQRTCYGLIKAYPGATPVVLYLFFKLAWFVNNGDPSIFLKDSFHFLVFMMIFATFLVVRKVRLNPRIAARRLETPGQGNPFH